MDIIVAENLKKLREKHNLTQEALALEWGVPELAIYKWEAGRLPVEYKMLQRIADFYDVTVETFFVDDSAEKHKPSANDKVRLTAGSVAETWFTTMLPHPADVQTAATSGPLQSYIQSIPTLSQPLIKPAGS